MHDSIIMADPTPEVSSQEASCLPVSREIVESVLSEMTGNPARALIEEEEILRTKNPNLMDALFKLLKIDEVRSDLTSSHYLIGGSLKEGALWAHRILRKQAELRGGQLPVISSELEYTHFVDLAERIKKSPETTVPQFVQTGVGRLTLEEPELGKALAEMTRTGPNRDVFNFGAAEVYFIIKKAVEGKRLERIFGF